MAANIGNGSTGTAKFLHWLIVALLIVQFALAWTMPMGLNAKVETLIGLHFSFGVLIFIVAVVRLSWRATHVAREPVDGLAAWQVHTASFVRGLLYLLILTLPIFGWLNASLARHAGLVFRCRRGPRADPQARGGLALDWIGSLLWSAICSPGPRQPAYSGGPLPRHPAPRRRVAADAAAPLEIIIPHTERAALRRFV
jgi:cytochrome b561